MGQATGNPEWKDYPDESTPVTAQALNNIEDALDGIGGGGGGVVFPSYEAVFIPALSSFTPSNSARWSTTYNPESVRCTHITVTSLNSGLHNPLYKYKLVVYKAGPTAAELIFETPVITGIAGEGMHSFTTGNVVFPRGVLFVRLVALSGGGGLFRSGMQDKFGAPRRDVNNEGAVDMIGLGTINELWTAPATLSYDNSRWNSEPIPHISMNGMVPA